MTFDKKFIDLFAGCGGLSLGLTKAGWQGVFAIEKTSDAFSTFKHNLIDGNKINSFNWPNWLECRAMTTSELLTNHKNELMSLRGEIDLIAGGPPCQGFSFAGLRNPKDPRNRLTEEYIEIVKLVKPKVLLLENVKGFNSAFKEKSLFSKRVYAEIVKEKLENVGYKVYSSMINSSMFGVPQPRNRFIMISVLDELNIENNPFEKIKDFVEEYRKSKELDPVKFTTVKDAISDLEIGSRKTIESSDNKRFQQITFKERKMTNYQKLMRIGCDKKYIPNSLRLARHNEKTLKRFKVIMKTCERGKSVPRERMLELGTKKQCFTILHPNMMSRTITTLPDDLLHYKEARILTVRENARIQSFPDWFEFQGKYTTGGVRRKEECPRYSQVGNAVPPLMAEALGQIIMRLGI
ncbi:MAG: DNA cytosine methyltransferase [Alphaproteobacteria bacterium]|nr:DNA cytosine methyltransferase [Alphaproteobacteria bacterium]